MQVVTGSPETLAAAAWAASTAVRASEVRCVLMPALRTEALICYRLNAGEAERRRQARAGSICSADVLDLLLALPLGMPVPASSLTHRECAALERAPASAVTIQDEEVTRHAVTPLAVELAVVAARSWRRGLEVAGRFAPFCARAMVLPRLPRDLAELELEARFYGVGVIVADGREADVLIPPAPFRRGRWTAAGWRFLENVYQAAL